jgi:acyl-[acyl-carrier-protein] desaturase
LASTAGQLLDRHAGMAREWFPHELVDGGVAATPLELPAGVRSALVVNLLTEDNLPLYFAALLRAFGAGGAWGLWVRRWTAEEMRHATVIRAYVNYSQGVDLRTLERDRFAHVLAADVPEPPTIADALVYLSLQERATRIAHANTGRCLPDTVGRAVMSTVAADENLHHLFYRDLVAAALDLSPSEVVIAISRQVRGFAMPGAAIRGFADHARAIASAGVYSTAIYLEQVVIPLVSRHWPLGQLEGLSPEAERARRRLDQFVARLRQLVPRLPAISAGPPAAAGAPAGSS